MSARRSGPRRDFLVPEVIQSSAMDCGPAALKAALDGFGIRTSYGRLREACQTAVDGTSIDALEELAQKLGLESEQIMIPADHLFAEQRTLPAIILTTLPNGSTHFVVLWRRYGRLLQVMDPTIGRRWVSMKAFLSEVFVHRLDVSAADWRDAAGDDEFTDALYRRFEDLGVRKSACAGLIEAAVRDPDWSSIAALDAALRMVQALVSAGAVGKGREALRVVSNLEAADIPESYWSARGAATSPDGETQLRLTGVVLVRFLERRKEEAAARESLPAELAAVFQADADTPGRRLLSLLRLDGLFSPAVLLGALAVSAGAVLLEALLFRSLLEAGQELALSGQRLGALVAILVLGLSMLLLEVPVSLGLWRVGRRLEVRLRMAFLEKVPRLGDLYFASRLSSDMAERSHSIHQIRNVGTLAGGLIAAVLELLFLAIGISWLDPASAPYAFGAAIGAVVVPLLAHRGLAERDLRIRSHSGALSRFYLDALVGLVPIRAHTAEGAMQREHESLLSEWSRAGFRLQSRTVTMLGWQLFVGFGLSILLVVSNLLRDGGDAVVLLLVYWALTMPVLGQQIAMLWSRYPWQRNVTLRLMEPLNAVDALEEEGTEAEPEPSTQVPASGPVAITMRDVSVVAGGHRLLSGVNLDIAPGLHVGIVGPSGAGKTTLVGLLLGWLEPDTGTMMVDGEPLGAHRLEELRRRTAWVDPTVRLWNRTLMENLTYGNREQHDLASTVEESLLEDVLRTIPEGMQTVLGEGGCLLSGGEGQRVRFGRAFMRGGAGLVILDEPYRGLDRDSRDLLLRRSRRRWKDATLLYVTHDVHQTLQFDRVVVVDQGRLVEQGAPSKLASDPSSRYSELLSKEREVHEKLWSNVEWRRLWMHDGRLNEEKTGEDLT